MNNYYVISGVLVSGMVLTVGGCSHYYRVTDSGSGKSYSAQGIHEGRRTARSRMTGREAPSPYRSQVIEIWAEEYEAGLNGQIRS